MHLVVSGYDASPNTSPPKFFSVPWAAAGPVGKELRVPGQASLLASSNDGFLFVSLSQEWLFLRAFCDTSTRISGTKPCIKAPLSTLF